MCYPYYQLSKGFATCVCRPCAMRKLYCQGKSCHMFHICVGQSPWCLSRNPPRLWLRMCLEVLWGEGSACEKVLKKFWTGIEEDLKNSWTCIEKIRKSPEAFLEKYEQVLKKSWTSPEAVLNKSWESLEKADEVCPLEDNRADFSKIMMENHVPLKGLHSYIGPTKRECTGIWRETFDFYSFRVS